MAVKVKFGEKLYLALQLYNGVTTKRVFVDLKDTTGALKKPRFELTNAGAGVYLESSETMPTDDKITAHFYVYELDGVTLDTNYTIAVEEYLRDITGEIVADNIDKKLSDISTAQSDIYAEIESSNIENIIESLEISGIVDIEGELEGVIEDV